MSNGLKPKKKVGRPHALEPRLEDQNARIAFLEEVSTILIEYALNAEPMARAKLLSRYAILTHQENVDDGYETPPALPNEP